MEIVIHVCLCVFQNIIMLRCIGADAYNAVHHMFGCVCI